MAYMIKVSSCTGCFESLSKCPNTAISNSNFEFAIDPDKCTEGIGFFDAPQCVAAGPIPKTCVINPNVPRYQAA